MGKRSNFERVPQDLYETPKKAVRPLLPFLPESATYYEPCYGNGALARVLPIRCVGHSDAESDARTTIYQTAADLFITNPPWRRQLLHPIIENLRTQRPTWLLLDSDWMFTVQASRLLSFCAKIVTVGRQIWISGTDMTGMENCAWYLFGANRVDTVFYPRVGSQVDLDLFDRAIPEVEAAE